MSVRDEYPQLARLTTPGIRLDDEAQRALTEIALLRDTLDEVDELLRRGLRTSGLLTWMLPGPWRATREQG